MASRVSAAFVRAWYQGAWWLYFLLPLALLYRFIITLRRSLYTLGIKKTYKSHLPLVVVGNISLGGTGKSPLVTYLVKSLQKKGYQPGIISRGYGADISVQECREVLSSSLPSQVGDEPLMLKQRLGCPVFVSPNRQLSIAQLEQAGCDIIIADDGMQHYAMQRDIEICVFDSERKLGNGYVLPMGPLREPASRVQNADFIVVNGGSWQPAHERVMTMQLVPGDFLPLDNKETASFDSSQAFYAVAAIGNPERFFTALKKMGLTLETQAFDDHHAFIRDDFVAAGDRPIIMTEKDAVKCASLGLKNAWYLPVDAKIDGDLADQVITQLKQKGYFNG